LLHRARAAADAIEIEERALDLAEAVIDAVLERRATSSVVRAATRRTHGEIVEELQRLLAASWRRKVELADLANALRWSPYHLARLFRAATGSSIHGYVTALRLRHAVERMRETRDELAEIALDCGFASQSHFADSFRREFGCAPSQLRR
jgi:AraC family transcriptional regulator